MVLLSYMGKTYSSIYDDDDDLIIIKKVLQKGNHIHLLLMMNALKESNLTIRSVRGIVPISG